MSSVYSSNKSSRRVSHATAASNSPPRSSPFKAGRISDVIADLAKYNPGATPQSTPRAQTLWRRRASAKSTEVENVPPTEIFNLDLLEAYEEQDVDPETCVSPALSDRPPRTSSLAHTTISSRSLSADTDFNGSRIPPQRPQKGGGWMGRPHPLRGKTFDVSVGPTPSLEIQSARLPQPLPFLEMDPGRANFQKKHRRHMTISESKRAARNTIFVAHPSGLTEHDLPPLPGLPALSPSNSTTTSVPSLTPTTPLSALAPTEDQIRRELEMMALREGADPLLNHRYGGEANSELLKELENEIETKPGSIPRQRTSPSAKNDDQLVQETPDRSQLRRRRSIVEYFRRSPVDKLLDLYLDDSPTHAEKVPPDRAADGEKAAVKRKPSLARRMTINLRSGKEKVPVVPPLPGYLPGHGAQASQSRFDFD